MDVLKGGIDQVISILKAPEFQDEGARSTQREEIWRVIREIFDFDEMAGRTTAQYWRIFSRDEKKEFSVLFSKLLGDTYLDKIQKYSDEDIVYLSQEGINEVKSLVKTKLVRKDLDIPISYNMYKTSGTWKVYDVNIEGVSLVQNYRAQFTKILINKSPAALIEMLKNKLSEQGKK